MFRALSKIPCQLFFLNRTYYIKIKNDIKMYSKIDSKEADSNAGA